MPLPAEDHYLREKLNVAVDCLATSAAPIQKRLENAGISALLRLTANDFPDPRERELFERVHAALTKVNAPAPEHEGHLAASTSAMSDEVAVDVARDIVELRGAVVGRTLRGD